VFLTVCTEGRSPWLAAPAVHDLLKDVWRNARAWLVGRYVIMPDHLHLFASPGELDLPFDNWVRYWKSQFTKRHRFRAHAWQTDHWDRRLRSEESYDGSWEYVMNNPVREGLVTSSEAWPFQGELCELRWD
jgi:putative transposase